MHPDRPSRTAEAVCLARALERARPPAVRILDDPHAAAFLDPAPLAPALAEAAARVTPLTAGLPLTRLATFVVARHRWLDDALLDALPTVEQVVILGAGYDTRAWRLAAALGDRPVWEVDHPATAARKRARLPAAGLDPARVRAVTVDFRHQRLVDRLAEAGFPRGRPTFFTWEGVTMYLSRAEVLATLRDLAALGGPGSTVALDLWTPAEGLFGAAERLGGRALELLGEPLRFGLPPHAVPVLFAEAGWELAEAADAEALERRYVRDGRRVYPTMRLARAER